MKNDISHYVQAKYPIYLILFSNAWLFKLLIPNY